MIDGYLSQDGSVSSTLGVTAITTLLLVLAASPATAEGFNLSWEDCGLNGTMTKVSACDSDVGVPFVLSGSFVPPPGIDNFVGVMVELGFSGDGALSDWWRFGSAPCRSGVSLLVQGPASQSCSTPYGGTITTSFSYDFERGGACMTLTVSTDPGGASALDPTTEYEAFRILIPRDGTSSCRSACLQPTCIGVNWIRLMQSTGAGDVLLSTPHDRHFVNWQSVVAGCPATDAPWPFGSCDRPTSPLRSTWGKIRQLYR